MKRKILHLLICLIMVLPMTACGSKELSNDSEVESVSEEKVWNVETMTDDFGDPVVGQSMLKTEIDGTFSNTATTDSELGGYVYLMPENDNYKVVFHLLEYNDVLPTYTSSDNLILKTKIDGVVEEFTLNGTSPNGELILDSTCENGTKFFVDLAFGNDVKCVIEIGSSQYNFVVECGNFASACSEMNLNGSIEFCQSGADVPTSLSDELVADIEGSVSELFEHESSNDVYYDFESITCLPNKYFVKMIEEGTDRKFPLEDKLVFVYELKGKFKKQSKKAGEEVTVYGLLIYNGVTTNTATVNRTPDTMMLFEYDDSVKELYLQDSSRIDDAVNYQFTVRSAEGFNSSHGTSINYEVSKVE